MGEILALWRPRVTKSISTQGQPVCSPDWPCTMSWSPSAIGFGGWLTKACFESLVYIKVLLASWPEGIYLLYVA